MTVQSFRQHRDFIIIRDPDTFFDQPEDLDVKAGPPGELSQGEPLGFPLLTDGLTQNDSEIADGRGDLVRFRSLYSYTHYAPETPLRSRIEWGIYLQNEYVLTASLIQSFAAVNQGPAQRLHDC